MSYVNKKLLAFRDAGDTVVTRKRSEGRMKTYVSATDARAWCNYTEERRQYILDLVTRESKGVPAGKIIPLEALIDILVKEKNQTIIDLQNQLDALRDFINKLDLSPEQKAQLQALESTFIKSHDVIPEETVLYKEDLEVRSTEEQLEKGAEELIDAQKEIDVDALCADGQSGGAGSATSGAGSVGEAGSATGGGGAGSVGEAGSATGGGAGSVGEAGSATGGAGSIGAAGSVTGEHPGSIGEAGSATGGAAGSIGEAGSATGSHPRSIGEAGSVTGRAGLIGEAGSATGGEPGMVGEAGSATGSHPGSIGVAGSATGGELGVIGEGGSAGSGQAGSIGAAGSAAEGELAIEGEELLKLADLSVTPGTGEGFETTPEGVRTDYPVGMPSISDIADGDCAAFAEAAITQLEVIKSIVKDEDVSKKTPAAGELSAQKGPSGPKPAFFENEICELEYQIREMRRSNLSPKEEAELIKKELDVLKKYCTQLSAIQKENSELKKERDFLKSQISSPGESPDGSDLDQKMQNLDDKLAKLEEITAERDRLRIKVSTLEGQLKNYTNLPNEVENFRQKSQKLDDIQMASNDFKSRLKELRGLDNEIRALREKANRCSELTDQLDKSSANQEEYSSEMAKLKCQCKDADKSMGEMKDETCYLKAQLKQKDHEVELLKSKERELEFLKGERNCLKMRLEDMKCLQQDYEDLLKKTKGFDQLKARYNELLEMEEEYNELKKKCDKAEELEMEKEGLMEELKECECHIANQDGEIKRLMCHVNCLSEGRDQQQDRMKTALVSMRAKLDKKESVIATSEQKLAVVQDQLKDSIEGVACETSCLKTYIDELENQLRDIDRQLKDTNQKLNEETQNALNLQANLDTSNAKINEQTALIDQLQEEVEALKKKSMGDEHTKEILKLSKCAVIRVTEVLQKRFDETQIIEKQDVEGVKYEKTIKKLEKELKDSKEKVANLEETASKLEEAYQVIDVVRAHASDRDVLEMENSILKGVSNDIQKKAQKAISDLSLKLLAEKEQQQQLIDAMKNQAEKNTKMQVELDGNAREQPGIPPSDNGNQNALLDEIQRLKAENEGCKNKLEEVTKDCDKFEQESRNLRQQTEQMYQLQAELDKKDEMLNQLNTGDQDLVAVLKEQLDKEKQLRGQAENTIQDFGERLATRSMDAETHELVKLKQEMDVNSAEIDRLKNELEMEKKKCQEKIEAMSKQPDTVGGSDGELLDEIKALKTANNELQQRIKFLENENEELRKAAGTDGSAQRGKKPASMDSLESKTLEKLGSQVKNLSKQKVAKKHRSSTAGMDVVVSDLKKKLEEEASKLKDCEENLKALQGGDKLLELQYENKELRDRIARLEEENNKLQGRSGLGENEDNKENAEPNRNETVSSGQPRRNESISSGQPRKNESISSGQPRRNESAFNAEPNRETVFKSHYEFPGDQKRQSQEPLSLPKFELCTCKDVGMTTTDQYDCGCTNKSKEERSGEGDRPQTLLRKIKSVEEKLRMQQEKFAMKVEMLQSTVDKFKRDLGRERQKNCDLTSRYNNQNKTVASMLMEMDIMKQENVTDKKQILQFIKANENLRTDLQKGNSKVDQLEQLLNTEQQKAIVCSCNKGAARTSQGQNSAVYTEAAERKFVQNRYECACSKKSRPSPWDGR